MKYIIILATLILGMSSCLETEDSKVFDTKKLYGKYKLHIPQHIIKEVINEDDAIASGAMMMMLQTFNSTLSFYPNNKAAFTMYFMGKYDITYLEYKKVGENKYRFKEVGKENNNVKLVYINTFSDNFDYIELKIDDNIFNLSKISN